jgi:hypothetical protein
MEECTLEVKPAADEELDSDSEDALSAAPDDEA